MGKQTITTFEYALLALIAHHPSSGYELTQRLKKPIGFFWTAHHSHIYNGLTHLEARGLIAREVIAQQRRPNKHLFTITEAGIVALRAWVTMPLEPEPPRSGMTLRAYAIWLADPQAAVRLFRQQEALHLAQLEEYERLLASIEQEHTIPQDINLPWFGNYATLRRGIGAEREIAEWCRWMAEQFERHLDHAGDDEQAAQKAEDDTALMRDQQEQRRNVL
jgi:DNA-binding PadR family transcriptional regulator